MLREKEITRAWKEWEAHIIKHAEMKEKSHVMSRWDGWSMITTILLFELTVASHQRMTVKKECRSQRGDPQMFILGDLTRVAWYGKEEGRSQTIG